MLVNQARNWGRANLGVLYTHGEMEEGSHYLEPSCHNVTYHLGWGRWVGKSGKYEEGNRVRNKFSHVIRNGPFNHKKESPRNR